MRTVGPFSRVVSSLLAAALVLTAPGLPFYRAAAEIVPVSTQARSAAPGLPVVAVTEGPAAFSAAGVALPLGANPLSHRSLIGDFPRAAETGVRPFRTPVPVSLETSPESSLETGVAADSLPSAPLSLTDVRALSSPSAELALRELRVPLVRVSADPRHAVQQAALGRRQGLIARRVDHLQRQFASVDPGVVPSETSPAAREGFPGPETFVLQARKLSPELHAGVPSVQGDGSSASSSPPGGSRSLRAAMFFVLGQMIGQVGVEAWGTYFAKWAQVNYGIGEYSLLTFVSMLGTLGAGYVGGVLIDKLGLKRTYIAAIGLSVASIASALLFFKFGVLPFPLLVFLVSSRDFLTGVGRTAEQTIPVAIYPDRPNSLERLNAIAEFALNAVGIVVPFLIGNLLVWFGSLGTMGLLPVTGLAALLVYALLMPIKEGPRAPKAAVEAAPAPDAALLRIGTRAYPAFVMLYFFFFQILAISYGNYLHPGTTPVEQDAAAVVAGKLMSLYSVGGMIAAAALAGMFKTAWGWLQRLTAREASLSESHPAPAPAADVVRDQLKSTLLWMRLGALGLLSFVPLLWTNLVLSSAAMVVFGLTNMMGILKLLAVVQENAPPERKGKTMGLVRTWAILGATVGVFGFGQLASAFPGSPFPFAILLAVVAAVGLYYLWTARQLSQYLKRPKS